MVMAIVQMGEHAQTMGRQVVSDIFAEGIGSVIAIAIWKGCASSSERRGTWWIIRW